MPEPWLDDIVREAPRPRRRHTPQFWAVMAMSAVFAGVGVGCLMFRLYWSGVTLLAIAWGVAWGIRRLEEL